MTRAAAHSLEEEVKMLTVLTGTAQLAVALASFSGLSLAELRGLDWSDYDGHTLRIRRNLWKNIVGKPRAPRRRRYVPVISQLRRNLDMWRKDKGWVLATESGEAWNIDWITRSVIIPALKKAGLAWLAFLPSRVGHRCFRSILVAVQ